MKTFKVLDVEYAMTSDSVYYYGQVVQGADAETFELFDKTFARDKYAVYEDGKKYYDVDPKKFHKIKKSKFYTDGSNIYFYSSKLKDVDIKNFRVLEDQCATDGIHYFDGAEASEKSCLREDQVITSHQVRKCFFFVCF